MMKGRIKLGANVFQSCCFYAWPGAEKDPNILFDIKWEYGHWYCTADGYGVHGCSRYGNGSIIVRNRDGVEIFGMSQDNEKMYYVAVDRDNPNGIVGLCCDDPNFLEDTADEVARWIKRGLTVMRLSTAQTREMMSKSNDKRDL